jgi:hypothetical protein
MQLGPDRLEVIQNWQAHSAKLFGFSQASGLLPAIPPLAFESKRFDIPHPHFVKTAPGR